MAYFNYHGNIKKKIKQCNNTHMLIVNSYNNISPCLLVIIDDNCYPIREYRWQEYFELADSLKIIVQDKRGENENKFNN